MKLTKLLFFTFIILITTSCIPTTNNGVSPTADFSANQTAINLGDSINFNDLSSGTPTSWSWTFQGGTPATSTIQNPSNIRYSTAGTYNVTLVVSNASGNNTITKTAYIVVTTPNTQIPTISTTTISGITNTSASSGGNITTEGSSAVTARGVCWNTTSNPTIVNTKTTNGTGIGIFSSSLTGLIANTTYYVRAYATNSFGTAYGNQQIFTTMNTSLSNCGTVKDVDGNLYHTVTIGTQCWMLENLKTTRYKDSTIIPTGLSNTSWQATFSGAYAIFDNNPVNNTTYGKLYNWYAVNTGKLAPAGWRVPTDNDFTILTNYLGGESEAGNKMKDTTLWVSFPGITNTNNSNFTGLPAGIRFSNGTFGSIGFASLFWSSTGSGIDFAWNRNLNYSNSRAERVGTIKQSGYSVRCIKD